MLKSILAAAAATLLAVSAAPGALAQTQKSAADIKAEADAINALTEAKAKAEQAEADKDDKEKIKESFAGFQLGAGLSLTLDSGSSDRVTSAQLVNNIVRVDNEDNAIARIMLETHYFFTPDGCLFGLGGGAGPCTLLKSGEWGWGPFIAIQPGEGEIVDAIGAGLMLGFRRPGRTDSFNIGIGAVVDPNSRILGDGIEPNQPLPVGETEIRYKEKEQWGIVLITSYTF